MKTLAIIFSAIVIGIALGWFEYRPEIALKQCRSDYDSSFEGGIESCSRVLAYWNVTKEQATAALERRGALYFDNGNFLKGHKDIDSALAMGVIKYPHSTYLARAEIYFRAKRYEQAIRDVNASKNISEQNRWANNQAYHLMANILFEQERYDAAISEMRLYVFMGRKHDPSAHEYVQLGYLYERMDRCEEALEVYREAILSEPTAGISYFRKSSCEIALGKYADAKRSLEKAAIYLNDFDRRIYKIESEVADLESKILGNGN